MMILSSVQGEDYRGIIITFVGVGNWIGMPKNIALVLLHLEPGRIRRKSLSEVFRTYLQMHSLLESRVWKVGSEEVKTYSLAFIL